MKIKLAALALAAALPPIEPYLIQKQRENGLIDGLILVFSLTILLMVFFRK